ncbi:hypothetical protein [Streptosporangium sp. NPDC002721]|uniref:hypothetical protein n=1 Tax=Streptosporangium sp. NPDC002721 TaxID=3366188 RepID=UPI0036B7F12A
MSRAELAAWEETRIPDDGEDTWTAAMRPAVGPVVENLREHAGPQPYDTGRAT